MYVRVRAARIRERKGDKLEPEAFLVIREFPAELFTASTNDLIIT